MPRHTKTFYRAVARIRAIGSKNGTVFLDRLKTKLNIGYLRAAKLKQELIEAGVLRDWTKDDLFGGSKKMLKKGSRIRGNILWKNIGKYRVPKEITLNESSRVKTEKQKGLL